MAKVLLVEDDNNLREIYQARLSAEGYEIIAAQNGEEALVVAKQNKPDLIISDVMMPRISGFEMLDILRNTDELKHTKVIMLTALGQAEDQKRANNLGADKYLVKSQVTLEDIVNAAKELLNDSSGAPAPATPATDTTPATPTDVTLPAVAPEPVADATTVPTAIPGPVASDPLADPATVPASVVPQADTTVVVPPAPANPTPPTVTVAPMPPVEPAADPATTTTTDQPADGGTATAEAAVADAATQSLKSEETAVHEQIDSYTNEPVTPALAVEPTATETADANNDKAIADAVQALNTPSEEAPVQPPSVANRETTTTEPTPAPEPTNEPGSAPTLQPTTPTATTGEPASGEPVPSPSAAAAPAGAPAESAGDSVVLAGKKVISPIEAPEAKPDLNELLAQEEAKDAAAVPPAPSAEPAPASPTTPTPAPEQPSTPTAPTTPPNTPSDSTNLNNVAL